MRQRGHEGRLTALGRIIPASSQPELHKYFLHGVFHFPLSPVQIPAGKAPDHIGVPRQARLYGVGITPSDSGQKVAHSGIPFGSGWQSDAAMVTQCTQ